MSVSKKNIFRFNENLTIRLIVVTCLMSITLSLSAQNTLGTTGLLNSPSAEMQRDGTVMFGGNFLNKHITPSDFRYHTYNYFLNITFVDFVEASYVCTLLKATDEFVPHKKGRFVNQDRSLSLRVRLLKESQYWPAIVVGSNDIYTQVNGGVIAAETENNYFSRFYVATTKNVKTSVGVVGFHLSYVFNRRSNLNDKVDGIAGGICFKPNLVPQLNLIAQYDSKDFCIGANYLLFDHLFTQVVLQQGRYLTAGFAYKIYLKK